MPERAGGQEGGKEMRRTLTGCSKPLPVCGASLPTLRLYGIVLRYYYLEYGFDDVAIFFWNQTGRAAAARLEIDNKREALDAEAAQVEDMLAQLAEMDAAAKAKAGAATGASAAATTDGGGGGDSDEATAAVRPAPCYSGLCVRN